MTLEQIITSGVVGVVFVGVNSLYQSYTKRRTDAGQTDVERAKVGIERSKADSDQLAAVAGHYQTLMAHYDRKFTEYEARIAALVVEKTTAEHEYQRDRQALIAAHTAALAQLKTTHEGAIAELNARHNEELADLRRTHEEEISKLEARIKNLEVQRADGHTHAEAA